MRMATALKKKPSWPVSARVRGRRRGVVRHPSRTHLGKLRRGAVRTLVPSSRSSRSRRSRSVDSSFSSRQRRSKIIATRSKLTCLCQPRQPSIRHSPRPRRRRRQKMSLRAVTTISCLRIRRESPPLRHSPSWSIKRQICRSSTSSRFCSGHRKLRGITCHLVDLSNLTRQTT